MSPVQRRVGERLGEILVNNGAISAEQLQRALDFQRQEGGLLGEILVKLGYVNEREIVNALTAQYGFPFMPLENYEPNEKVTEIVPENVAKQYSIVPIDTVGNLLTIAMANPLNDKAVEDIEMMTQKKVQVFISTVTSIHEAIKRLYKKAS